MLGHKLGMSVTAEGIETQAQADILKALSCDQLQGYLFGRPVPADQIAALFGRAESAGLPKMLRTGEQ